MHKKRIAINGFGRIGRCLAKINIKYSLFDLVLINDINNSVDNLSYLFKYDSTYGRFEGAVSTDNNNLIIIILNLYSILNLASERDLLLRDPRRCFTN